MTNRKAAGLCDKQKLLPFINSKNIYKLEKISQFLKFALFLDFIYWFTHGFETMRRKITTSILINLVKLGTISLTAHFLNCVNIGKTLYSGKRFVKLAKGFKDF